jgi:glycosidase
MSALKNNIKFNYLYRDGSNYKVGGYEVFSNPESLELKIVEERIRESLIDGDFFDPEYWKVKRLKNEDWIPELDHTWNEYDSVEFTDETPTINLSIREFLNVISKIHKYWL